MKSKRIEQTIYGVCLAILVFLMCTIGLRFFVRQVLVKHMGVSNSFTDLVFFDAQDLGAADTDDATADGAGIDWEKMYPFSQELLAKEISQDEELEEGKLHKVSKLIQAVEEKIETYSSDLLIGYNALTDMAKRYESMIRWNYVSYTEYNGVIKLYDGYLTSFCRKLDVTKAAYSLVQLAQYCEEQGNDFCYIQAPYKISKYEDKDISGRTDFANQNADDLLEKLREAGVDTYDIRETIHDEGLSHHPLFYRTDHHWRGETGLWASKHILELLKEQYGYDIDASVLEPERFTSVDYLAWFLGSQGKKVRLGQTEPDDFSLLYPTYPTELHYTIPNLGIDAVGDFSVTYDMAQVEELDYYGKNPYGAYIYGDRPMETIENELLEDNGRLLVVHESFGNCVVPFLALGIKNVDSLDLRHFTGSVQEYIKQTEPDVVLVLYNPSVIPESIDWTTHGALFDFR